MDIDKKKITDKIHLLVFENQKELASTFVRFQEHCESPEFAGKIFSLEEFMDWYIKNSKKGQGIGKFTYYDWGGFNIQSYVIKPFYEGKFDLLLEQEKEFLKIFRNEEEPFYVIGVHKQSKDFQGYLEHETAHGLFYTDNEYRSKVEKILSGYDIEGPKRELIENGYSESVLENEFHAHAIDKKDVLENTPPEEMRQRLRQVYQEHLKKNDASFPEIK